ncbi:DeoR/GlpR family DNA-binding transcription regulator [Spiroplasma endosymbiont of Labia minor]|uniref:DeoR/GlpR family DNA-binding transcription regulator n=1 Tax=Spiroplasma endosymbiont of Labia minor TaxID=3066305 RepID=UPI0030D0D44F
MIKDERHTIILNYINKRELSYVEDIAIDLNIPLTTLRRDLKDLEVQKRIIKVHGGAKPIKTSIVQEQDLQLRLTEDKTAKQMIAEKAIKSLSRGSTVFIDAGSTTYFLCKAIMPEFELTIVTNSFEHIKVLLGNGNENIYLVGGKYLQRTGAFVGSETLSSLARYTFDVAFIGANALDDKKNIYTTNIYEGQVKELAIKQSQRAVILMTSNKLDKRAFVKIANLNDVILMTEKKDIY